MKSRVSGQARVENLNQSVETHNLNQTQKSKNDTGFYQNHD
jgi:hypothetical protein